MSNGHPIRFNLGAAVHAAMIEHGFQQDFPAGAGSEPAAVQAYPALYGSGFPPLRTARICSLTARNRYTISAKRHRIHALPPKSGVVPGPSLREDENSTASAVVQSVMRV
jgi:hypothetical protein